MSSAPYTRDLILVVNPVGILEPGPRIAAAAATGGGVGVIDLATGDDWALRALTRAAQWSPTPVGVRVPTGCRATLAEVQRAAAGHLELVVVEPTSPWPLAEITAHHRVLVEVTSRAEARAAAAAGAHGLIARGMEAGGRVGELSSFVLLQQLVADDTLDLPVWVAGGIGPRTAGACLVGGAAGVVLDTQLALMPESELPADVQAVIRRMDGSETVLRDGTRGIRRGGPHQADVELLPVGQDGWLAAAFADRWPDTATAVRGMRAAMLDVVDDPEAAELLQPGAPLAAALGVRVPVAQGPMTRVSDEASFAAAVADGGALPFIALALNSADQCRRIMTETAARLGDRPWGVGVLGFAPEELRAAQLDVIREIRPACAIIAGGRPPQARALEEQGISTFLHVPSPGLLRQFLRSGARKFIFEGAECGGHVGPRASFPLWEAQLAVLDEYLDTDPAAGAQLQIFFAGGVHDARSAAMVATMAAPLARRGARIGVLMGTAYLFTAEAVAHGAVQPLFQREALTAEHTALLETAPGHATRCLHTPFVDDFHRLRTQLESAGAENREVWEQLELLNVGRLRIASKGLRRSGDVVESVDESVQASEGLFMAGQVAVLRNTATTVAELHDTVTTEVRGFHAGRLYALRERLAPSADEIEQPVAPLDVAIVGMACMLPGSPDLDSFWRTVLSGTDTVTEVPADRWDTDHYYAPEVGPGQTGRISVSKWGGFIEPVPFDAIGYGIPPAALSSIDPTQLLALEVSHRALVDAGYAYDAPGADHSRTGVVFGAEAGSDMGHAQTLRTMLPAYLGEVPDQMQELLPTVTEDSFPGVLANVIAGRVANRLDLGGPNYTIDAACASSLAAMDAACKELVSGDSDLMICGGADLHNGVNDYLMFTSAHALSPTGRSRPFDSTGDGIALGEGVACVVLKRLADAERDGDRIYGVIKGLGGASDGRALGLTAPRPDGQRRALDRAYHRSGISPREVGLVEAHGTGTVVGDRTELETLTRMFVESGAEPGGCALGSVKSQIGHTKCAAGLAGLIKATLALYHGVRPPTIHLERPNPAWHPQQSPFAFFTEARPWPAPAAERIAGVSAFGFGGTNFHVVLSAYPNAPEPRHAQRIWPAELFCFRGTDLASAHQPIRQLLESLAGDPGRDRPGRLAALAASVAAKAANRPGPTRVAVVARDLAELETLLRRALAGEHDPARGLVQPTDGEPVGPGQVAFLFPGQGSQRTGALGELFVAFPELRHYLELDRPAAELLFPPTAFDQDSRRAQEDRVRDTRIAQPVLGIGGLAMDHLLRRLGVRPDMTAGHSYGELVGLCVAGAFDAATLLDLSRERAAAILGACGEDPGTMAAVNATADQVAQVLAAAGLTSEVVLANRNAPQQVVVSGPTGKVRAAVVALKEAGLSARAIPVACAFHSPVVAGAVETFAEVLAARSIAEPRIPVWSNLTAAPYSGDADQVRHHLAEQIGAPVRFVEQVEAMYAAGARLFVEVGPGQVLSRLVQAVLGDRPHQTVACERGPADGLRGFLISVAELACAGVPVRPDWLFHGRTTDDADTTAPTRRPLWTVDGQLVRDQHGNCLPGGMTPPRRIKELSMTPANGTATTPGTATGTVSVPEPVTVREVRTVTVSEPAAVRDIRSELLSEYLRTTREMIATQRDVMLAFLGDPGGPGNPPPAQPTETHRVEGYAALPTGPAPTPTPVARPAVAPPARPAVAPPPAPTSMPTMPATNGGTAVATAPAPPVTRPTPVAPEARPVSSAVATVVAAPAPAAVATAVVAPTPAGPGIADFQQAILAVLSERTGYPVDLIELDLDLEADLSIDSIKRAEVAGEVAQRLSLSVEGDESELEDLVKARTVRAMVTWLDQKMSGTVTATATLTAALPSGDQVDVTAADFQQAILAVLSERTGYPVDLIEPDLDLEADLSIDSIKRAEVAGEVAQRLSLSVEGDESELEDLVKARTVRAMVTWLDQKMSGTVHVSAATAAPALPAAPAAAPAAPVAAPAAAVAAVATAPAGTSLAEFQQSILTVLSERTGYPVDLIELDLDLEADLSIDSIKRAEVAGEVAQRLSLSVEGDESELEDLVKARTVRAMVTWLDQKMSGTVTATLTTTAAVAAPAAVPTTPAPAPAPAPAGVGVGIAPKRLVAQESVDAGQSTPPTALAGMRFLITGGGPVGAYLAELLGAHGAGGQLGVLDSEQADQGFDGVLVLDGLTNLDEPLLPDVFPLLQRALATGPRWLFAAGARDVTGAADGMPGLFRTIAREYPELTARFVAVDPTATPEVLARQLLDELLTASDAPVVTRRGTDRYVADLIPVELGALAAGGAGPAGDGVSEAAAIGLERDSVVVLVGGARGITPWFARALASATGCRIELVGRTPLPTAPEDPELAAAGDRAALVGVLARRGASSPAEISRTAQRILAAREVTATITELTELGGEVRYHTLDVRDAEATRRLLADIHAEYGRLDGVVYAAGIIEDKLIAEKDPASFTRVFDTKVDGARGLLAGLDALPTTPRFLVFFGSIAAAYGNRGQADYAAANDALDSIGTRYAARTGVRCVTVHWGPWAPGVGHGGMVTAELSREYARRGIGLIDPEEGALALLRELAWADASVTSVVYTASGW
ncbi:type I polyketide synthase [Micromonospora sp. WMMD714]|uniref:type I polyketide synthase n=1 Tax=Micromonospora sp. WMMD714 TaxID=3016097 RepID=UPI00249C2A8B|nr:type I polyketide synthase [Micromonospora sp. WMMD714]WFE65368.1 SDR family NAD(P)-dependent oxidoreductase [Micromonospora sp. WMMD714]